MGLKVGLLLVIATAVAPAAPARAQTETADVSITSSWAGQGKPNARLGETVTLNFVVVNRGPATAQGLFVTTNESDAFNFESASCSDPALCSRPGEPPTPGIDLAAGSSATGTLVWRVASFPKGQSRTPDVTVMVSSSTLDPNPDDNQVVTVIRLVGPHHLVAGGGASGSLARLIERGDRDLIRAWAADRTIAEINRAVARLKESQRNRLAEIVLDSNATGALRDRLLSTMRLILAQPDLGFYAEIWSYTTIEMTPGGFFGTCGHLFLDPDAFGGLIDIDARNVLTHESFHSFNCVNGGPAGSLDEGSALWVIRAGFPTPLGIGESWAEGTYGTKLYYRDIAGNPNLPLEAPRDPSAKLLDVYQWLANTDPSRLPWNSTERLVACFERYFEQLDRNVDFVTGWLPAVQASTDLMLADPECRPL
jgi:uncharacterized repeat protein (TIGR01451 family)